MTDRKHRWWLITVPALILIVLVVGLIIQFRPGIFVTIENTGTTPLSLVVVHVTGASYELGNIAPGDSVKVRVRPNGESSLEIEFADSNGQTKRLDAGGYFESGYRGTIQISIKDGTIDKNEQDIRLW